MADHGVAEWEDDPSIGPDELLLRRIPPYWIQFDHNRGEYIPSSQAFDNDSEGGPMSVYVETLLRELGLEAADTLVGQQPGFGVAGITAGAARTVDQWVARDPLSEGHPCDPAHAVVVGAKGPGKRKRLRNSAQWWIVEPDLPGSVSS